MVTDRPDPSRPPGVTPAVAIRGFALKSVAGIRGIPADLWRGELGYLAAISPAVHRLALELTDRLAAALAAASSREALASVNPGPIFKQLRRERMGRGQSPP